MQRHMGIWETKSHLRKLENMESVGVMKGRARKVAKGSSVNFEPVLCLVLPHELKVPAGAQVMGGRRNLSKYRSKQEASCVRLRAKWAWEP